MEDDMKYGYVAVLIVFLFVSNACATNKPGNRDIVAIEQILVPFKELKINADAVVRLYTSQEYRTVVSADSNLIRYVKIVESRKKNLLEINIKQPIVQLFSWGGIYDFTEFTVDIYCPTLKSISYGGGAFFEFTDTLITPALKIDSSGLGGIAGRVECESLSIWMHGRGDIAIDGNAKNTFIDAAGTGNFTGNEFRTSYAAVKIRGTGNVNIWVEDYLTVNRSGMGTLIYKGKPIIELFNNNRY
jgi:hypothetical protein